MQVVAMKLHGELNFQPLRVWPLVWYADSPDRGFFIF